MRGYILAIAAAALATPTLGAGYYNMPTSLPQCLGMGFGPGYHAPLVLGPKMKAGIAAQPVQRIPAALAPPADCGFDAPTFWSEGPQKVLSVEPSHGAMPTQASPFAGSGPIIGSGSIVDGGSIIGSGYGGGVRVLPAMAPVAR